MKTETKIIISIALATIVIVVGAVFFLSKGSNKPAQTTSTGANVGDKAPNFILPATSGQNLSLEDYRGKKNALLYFHEGMTCDPCMQQIPDLEKSLDEFNKMNVAVLAVSGEDSVDQLKQGAQHFSIKQIPMLSYKGANTEVDYDLTRFSMGMGKRAGHTFVLVGTDGKILWRKDYWPGYGMMVTDGKMIVNSSEIVSEVKKVLNQ